MPVLSEQDSCFFSAEIWVFSASCGGNPQLLRNHTFICSFAFARKVASGPHSRLLAGRHKDEATSLELLRPTYLGENNGLYVRHGVSVRKVPKGPSGLHLLASSQGHAGRTPSQPRCVKSSASAPRPYKRIATSRAVAGAKGRSTGHLRS